MACSDNMDCRHLYRCIVLVGPQTKIRFLVVAVWPGHHHGLRWECNLSHQAVPRCNQVSISSSSSCTNAMLPSLCLHFLQHIVAHNSDALWLSSACMSKGTSGKISFLLPSLLFFFHDSLIESLQPIKSDKGRVRNYTRK